MSSISSEISSFDEALDLGDDMTCSIVNAEGLDESFPAKSMTGIAVMRFDWPDEIVTARADPELTVHASRSSTEEECTEQTGPVMLSMLAPMSFGALRLITEGSIYS